MQLSGKAGAVEPVEESRAGQGRAAEPVEESRAGQGGAAEPVEESRAGAGVRTMRPQQERYHLPPGLCATSANSNNGQFITSQPLRSVMAYLAQLLHQPSVQHVSLGSQLTFS